MRGLVACECSGIVRDAFRAQGHDAISCDLSSCERDGPHHVGDALAFMWSRPFDLMIAHPPCTYLASSGLHWNKRIPGRLAKHDAALAFVRKLLDANISRIAVENPAGAISSHIRKPDQYVQPWQFGNPMGKTMNHEIAERIREAMREEHGLELSEAQVWDIEVILYDSIGKLPEWDPAESINLAEAEEW